MFRVKQVYRAHRFIREVERRREVKKNADLIKKNKDARILVILHLFYPKSWKEIKEYINNLSDYNYGLIVTTTDGMIPSDIIKKILEFKPDTKVISCENRGFDLRPFLVALKGVNLDDYDIVIKLQSKSTKRAWIYIYDQFFMRRDWFLDLFEGILSAKVVHKSVDMLLNDDSVGLVAAKNLIVNDPLHKVEMVKKIGKEKNLPVNDDYKFVAGTCFAIKAECLKNIQDYPWTDKDFDPVPNSRGMSFAHFFERYICSQVESVWHKKLVGNDIRKARHAVLSVPSKILYKYSSYRLLSENIDFDPEFFYWVLDNKLITYKFEELPFKKIMYADHGVRMPFIKNAPYRYLKGDVDGYKRYCEYHEKHGLPLMSIERFEKLRESIKKKGYDERYIIIVNDRNELLDGQHRACCLCDQLGEDASIKVLKINFIGIKEDLKRILPLSVQKKISALKNNLGHRK
ncbi:rhamnan synthesis F family protein [Lactobacillus delbrueckii]|uniref:rhamnan synthesis F family protein n=1 Tax=Lactobacillus delbrueckii TaxID=1584 RepID=UPI001F192B38|nr:rhamnan synthesis F family protein [Lactobacillus delbrueckii]GHN17423.1 hypothetical protein ME782_18840 [Lactobacillus delbrueckii]